MKDIFRNIITFGGHNKVLTAETEFQEVREQLRNLDREQSVKREFVNLKLDEITDLKIEAVNTVKLIKKITSQISIKEREFIEENISHEEYSLEGDFRIIDGCKLGYSCFFRICFNWYCNIFPFRCGCY